MPFQRTSKTVKHAAAIHFMSYNFCRIHQALRVTPPMEAGITDHVWSLEGIVALLSWVTMTIQSTTKTHSRHCRVMMSNDDGNNNFKVSRDADGQLRFDIEDFKHNYMFSP